MFHATAFQAPAATVNEQEPMENTATSKTENYFKCSL